MYLQSCQARKRCPQKRRRCGAVLIEFAFVVPVMFTLVFATFEFGRIGWAPAIPASGSNSPIAMRSNERAFDIEAVL